MEEKLETRALLQVVLDDTADTKSRSMVILLAMRISFGFLSPVILHEIKVKTENLLFDGFLSFNDRGFTSSDGLLSGAEAYKGLLFCSMK